MWNANWGASVHVLLRDQHQIRRAIPRANMDSLHAKAGHTDRTFKPLKCSVSPPGRHPAMPGSD
jgi:hypothetical protein